MGCGGCSRNRNTSGSRKKPKKTTKAVPLASPSTIAPKELANRKKKCSRCPFNTVSGLSGRCKKTNRMISRAIADPSFKCPIKRF